MFNSIGEARRTIMWRREVVGVWDVDDEGIPNDFSIFESYKNLNQTVKRRFEKFSNDLIRHSNRPRLM